MNFTLRNKDTNEEWVQDFSSNSDKEKFLEENTNIEQILTSITIGDPVRLGVTKPPSDFQKYVLGKVKAKNPLGDVERKFGTIPREW